MYVELPDLCNNKEECCGCGTCSFVCPIKAITMNPDEEGFLYPIIDPEKCIGCGKCLKVCAFKSDTKMLSGNENISVYAVVHKDDSVRKKSRSGGVFTALSDFILDNDGVVYGSVLTDKHEVIHVRADNKETRDKMRGSKYVQSDLNSCFLLVQKDLLDNRKVLFTGTPCQISGLKAFLRTEYDSLYCMDIICHGVPSPLVWQKYINWQESKHKSRIKSVDFRNKKDYGWNDHVETLFFENGKKVNSRIYTTLFYSHVCVRPSCYNCPYKSTIRSGEITFGDYWGIEKNAPEFNDNKGVSLVLVNTMEGSDLFDQVQKDINLKKCKLKNSMQSPLKENYLPPINRTIFWNDVTSKSFDEIVNIYGRDKNKFRRMLSHIKKKLKV